MALRISIRDFCCRDVVFSLLMILFEFIVHIKFIEFKLQYMLFSRSYNKVFLRRYKSIKITVKVLNLEELQGTRSSGIEIFCFCWFCQLFAPLLKHTPFM